ncbi:hypothetical protein M378DRAFT_182312 [Amanita muscaria Koide BX008]|uniref:Uncharacterized protein n=1 Tax=Amanita muscaria (strain Koide BX008) TaxID=946122 RepID=A0A0C2WGB3_AMAMK|nr:hypothetical protein M378DRAFT_182312 [Amanita muscaria Koide BX008]
MSRLYPTYFAQSELSTIPQNEQLYHEPMSSIRFPLNAQNTRDINPITIGTASGEQLIQAGNHTYIQLLLEKSTIEKELLIAQKAQSDAFRNTYNEIHAKSSQGIASATTHHTHVSPTIPNVCNNPFLHELSHNAKGLFQREAILPTIFKRAYTQPDVIRTAADYNRVRFWALEDFKANHVMLICDNEGKKNTLPKKFLFLEDESGAMVPLNRLTSMRGILKGLFDLLKASLPEILKETWCQYDAEFQDIIYRELRAHFPELALCNDNWKARSLLIEWYCNWYSPSSHHVKTEHMDHALSLASEVLVSDTAKGSAASTACKRAKTHSRKRVPVVLLPPIRNPLFDIIFISSIH